MMMNIPQARSDFGPTCDGHVTRIGVMHVRNMACKHVWKACTDDHEGHGISRTPFAQGQGRAQGTPLVSVSRKELYFNGKVCLTLGKSRGYQF